MTELGLRLLGAVAAGIAIAALLRIFLKPTPRLAGRLRPYTAVARSTFRGLSDYTVHGGTVTSDQTPVERLLRPIAESIIKTGSSYLGGVFNDDEVAKKLRQSGILSDIPESQRVYEFRVRQVGGGLIWAIGTLLLAIVGKMATLTAIAVFVGGFVFGIVKRTDKINKEIKLRRETMRIELYTINQLLAIYLRTSGSPVLAAQRLVMRGSGIVIGELKEALRLHTRGMSATKAFGRLASVTPEPYAARTYKLLASGSERGADLSSALLSLSADARESRRQDLKRRATKRQASMLIPIIGVLAPVMLLFIGAPIPSFIFFK